MNQTEHRHTRDTGQRPTASDVDVDQVDLLITAARQWRILTDRTAATLSPQLRRNSHVAAPDAAGQQILALAGDPAPYRYTPVLEDLDPIEVLKTCHRLEHLFATVEAYAQSPTRQLLARLARAASERVPGYAEAPWRWRRNQQAGALVIATAALGADFPSPLAPGDLTPELWNRAALVVVADLHALEEVQRLPPRDDVVLYLPDSAALDRFWSAHADGAVAPATVVTAPHGTPWLIETIQRHRKGLRP